MTSLNENRLVNETAFDKKCSEKYTAMEKQKTKNDLAQRGVCQKNSVDSNNSKADYESLYESLMGHKTQQEKSVFHGKMYLKSFLLLLVFLTAVSSLALSLAQFNMSPGSGSAEGVKPVHSAEMKAKSQETHEVPNATLLRPLKELRKQVGEVNFILSELKLEQKQAMTNLTTLMKVHSEEMKVENSHLKDALNITRLQLEKLKEQVKEMKGKEVKQNKNPMANLTILVGNKTGPPRNSGKECLKVAINNLANKLENLAVMVNKTCPGRPPPASSCKELFERNPSLKSGVYKLLFGSQEIPVYCQMGDFGCGDGGWTPVMKINGSKETFRNDSRFWSNKETFNLAGGKTGFDKEETKLPTYWITPFSKICLGMKIDQKDNFVSVDKEACSLYSLIADGQYRATSLGRDTWKSLIGSAGLLQPNCNNEGFNAVRSRYIGARIGILGSKQNDCSSPGSRIGFGIGGYPDDSNTCGYEAIRSQDNGARDIKAMGYILVQ